MAGATQHLHGKMYAYVLWGTVGREPESRKENKVTWRSTATAAAKKATSPI